MSVVLPHSAAASGPALPDPQMAKIHKTAQQFEAIFIRQMLAAARKTSVDSVTGSRGEDSFVEQQDAHFADLAAQRGSFGLGRMIEKQLRHQQGLEATPGPKPATFTTAAER